jgi:outer membrane protein assembly factor BamB
MKKTKTNKTKAILIALLLLTSMATALIAFPDVSAQTSQSTLKTYAFIGVTPNPVGIGQDVLLHVGITRELTNVAMGWDDLSVTITRPDGTTETISGIRTDSTGGTGRVYVPNMVGNYSMQTHFPQQITTASKVATGAAANTTMAASDSEIVTLIVQAEAMPINPGIPLPTEYWTRPINAQFREWYTVSGSSWMSNEYNEAPNSPHILWTKPLTSGGLAGGELGLVGSGATSVAFENGDAYEGKWLTSLILAGKLYYQDSPGNTNRVPVPSLPVEYHCVDLRTGEELWTKTFLDNRSITFGQMYYWESYNFQGTFAYLWVVVGNTWTAFDAASGDWKYTITDVPSGTRLTGTKGEIYQYNIDLTAGRMTLWNMSALISMAGSFGSSTYGREYNATSGTYRTATTTGAFGTPTTSGAVDRAARAWAMNITIPKGLPGSVRAVSLGDKVVGSSLNTTDVSIWAFSLVQGQEGRQLVNGNWKAPTDWAAGNQTLSWAATDIDTNIGLVWSKEERCHYAFSLETGQFLWVTESEHYLNIYSAGRRIYENTLYSLGQAGTVYAYDLATGKTLWKYEPNDVYNDVLWSNNWPEDIVFAQGGKLYLFHSEHSANQPLPRGAATFCLNATTGEVIWRVDGLFRKTDWGAGPIMGDSVIAMYNTYDQQVYAIGKGPSTTFVEAPMNAVSLGESIVIRGTVKDASPGTMQTALTLRFPNGVPAVSDASQGEWMKYVYAQFPYPTTATGVPVSIDVVDSNGNYRNVGTTTSDASGMFTFTWIPDILGSYTVYASFGGSESYYPSYAESSFVVGQPAPTPLPYPVTTQPPTDMYIIGSTVAIIIAIAVVGLLILRKRP